MTDVAQQFRAFVAYGHQAEESPLYARLSVAVADEPELLALADLGRDGQVRPNLFFAAVRYLLMAHPDDPLAAWHPDIGTRPAEGDPVDQLGAFCRRHRGELVDIITTRLVQTNEPLRASILRPALQEVQRRAGAPLAVVDVGCSLGVSLCGDHIAYDYGDGELRGVPDSPLRLQCQLRGPHRPPLDAPLDIAWRRGLELEPIDPSDAAAVAWLRALIWPGDEARLRRLAAAVELVRQVRPPVVKGNAAQLLTKVCAAAPADTRLCVITTYMRMHQTPRDRAATDEQLRELSSRRELSWLSTAPSAPDTEGVYLVLRDPRTRSEERLALHHPHGRWLEWGVPRSPTPGEDRSPAKV